MGNRTINRITAVVLLCVSSIGYAVNAAPFTGGEMAQLCNVKVQLLDWSIRNVDTLSTEDMIDQWTKQYHLLNETNNVLYSHTTRIDGERIIRDVKRVREKLTTPEKVEELIEQEVKWCAWYQH